MCDNVEKKQFKAKNSEMNAHQLCLGKFQKILQLITIKETGLNVYIYIFISFHYDTIDISGITDINI